MTVSLEVDLSKPLPILRSDYDSFRDEASEVLIDKSLYWEHADYFKDNFEAIREDNVLVYLNSSGGYMAMALIISEVISNIRSRGLEVRIVTGGLCQSAAMTVLMSVPPECRYAERETKFLIHSARFNDPETGRPMTGLSRRAQFRIRSGNNAQLRHITAGSHITEKSLRRFLKSQADVEFTSQEALDMGLVSAIV